MITEQLPIQFPQFFWSWKGQLPQSLLLINGDSVWSGWGAIKD